MDDDTVSLARADSTDVLGPSEASETDRRPFSLGLGSKSDATTNAFARIFGELQQLIYCKVCIRPMHEPHTVACGHTFCYSCLAQWFENHQRNKTCPECRTSVSRQPAPAYVVREMSQLLLSQPELLPPDEDVTDLEQSRAEEAKVLESDRSAGRLFANCFTSTARSRRYGFRDVEDRVMRCPECHWELENGWCYRCDYNYMEGNFLDESDSNLSGSELPHRLQGQHNLSTDGISLDAGSLNSMDGDTIRSSGTEPSIESNEDEQDTDLDGFIEDDAEPLDVDEDEEHTSTGTESESLHETISRSWNTQMSPPPFSPLESNRNVPASEGEHTGRGRRRAIVIESSDEQSDHRGDDDEDTHGRRAASLQDFNSSDSDLAIGPSLPDRPARKRRRVLAEDSDDDGGHRSLSHAFSTSRNGATTSNTNGEELRATSPGPRQPSNPDTDTNENDESEQRNITMPSARRRQRPRIDDDDDEPHDEFHESDNSLQDDGLQADAETSDLDHDSDSVINLVSSDPGLGSPVVGMPSNRSRRPARPRRLPRNPPPVTLARHSRARRTQIVRD